MTNTLWYIVVICFQISIFDTIGNNKEIAEEAKEIVVICFQISIFDTIGNNKINIVSLITKL